MRMLLERAGHEVISAESGRRGLRLFFEDRPDLVVLDLRMSRRADSSSSRRDRDTTARSRSTERDAALSVGRLEAGVEVAIPDAPHVHVFRRGREHVARRHRARRHHARQRRRRPPHRRRHTDPDRRSRGHRGARLSGDGMSERTPIRGSLTVVAVDGAAGRRTSPSVDCRGRRRRAGAARGRPDSTPGRRRSGVPRRRASPGSSSASTSRSRCRGGSSTDDLPARELWDAAAVDGERWLTECSPPFWGRPGTPAPRAGRAPAAHRGACRRSRWSPSEVDVPDRRRRQRRDRIGAGVPCPRPPAGRRLLDLAVGHARRSPRRGRDLAPYLHPARS